MVNKALTIKLFRDLWHRKITILAVILVLAVGVGSYFGMDSVYYDLDTARINYYQKYNLADFTLDIKRAPEAVISQLNNIPNVLRLRSRIKTDTMVLLPQKSYKKNINLIPGIIMSLPVPKRNIINNIKMIGGTWFSSPYAKEIIINNQFAQARNLHIGDRIEVRLPDKQYNLLIVGTVTSPEFATILAPGSLAPDPGGYAIMYMPRKFLQQTSGLDGSFNQLLGMVKNHSDISLKNTMTLLSDKLDNYGVQLQTAQKDQISAKVLHDELLNIKKTITFLPTMFFLVAMLILNVMIGRLVTQQRMVIGTLKAIGYTNFSILRHYFGFGFIVGIIGGILGIILGYALEELMLIGYRTYFALPNMVSHFYPKILLNGLAISVLSSFIGAIFGSQKAMRLEPAEAMNPPAPEKVVHLFLENFSSLWKNLSFQSKMIVRAIFRNKARSMVTIFASIIATALVFSSLGFLDSIHKMINFSFDVVQHQDYNMVLREPLGKNILASAAILPDVKKVEGQLSVPVELQNRPYEKRLEVTGLPINHELSTPVDKYGNQIKITQSGLAINETLAKLLNVKAGDIITVKPLIGNRTSSKVKVVKTMRTYLGLNAYANQAWLSRLLGNSYVANNVLFKLYENANVNKFIKEINKFAPVINLISLQKSKEIMTETFNEFLVFTIVILILFAGIIAIGSIINTAIISLNERERDVASLRVLGFTSMQTAKIFFGESFILNTIGIFLGLFVGIYFAYYMSIEFSTEIYRMPMVIKPIRMLQTALIMYGFVIISQAIVYYVIRQLKWFEVLNTRN